MTKEEIEQKANAEWGNVHRAGVLAFIDGAEWALQSENERLKADRETKCISLERAKKYARHQHYLGTQGSDLVEFEDWEYKPSPPKQ